MRTQVVIGVLLVVIGVVILMVGSFSYTTTHEAVKVGPLRVTTQEKKSVPVSPVFGGLLVVSGVVLLIAGRRRP